jgi:hypothetical protein
MICNIYYSLMYNLICNEAIIQTFMTISTRTAHLGIFLDVVSPRPSCFTPKRHYGSDKSMI